MKTEPEARKRWCPYARVGSDAMNRPIVDLAITMQAARCIASECMAWRWEGLAKRAETIGLSMAHATRPAEPGELEHHMQRRGFCGLAGRP